MKNTRLEKELVVSVIFLFIGIAVAPTINFNTVKASSDDDLNCPIKGKQSIRQVPWRYIGFVCLVIRGLKAVSFYSIFVIYSGCTSFEHQPYPFIDISSFEKITIPRPFIGIITRHFICVTVMRDWP